MEFSAIPSRLGGGALYWCLTHKAQSIGYHPEIILAGRRLNDAMGLMRLLQLVKAMIKKNSGRRR